VARIDRDQKPSFGVLPSPAKQVLAALVIGPAMRYAEFPRQILEVEESIQVDQLLIESLNFGILRFERRAAQLDRQLYFRP
jgi:hypothetical protein